MNHTYIYYFLALILLIKTNLLEVRSEEIIDTVRVMLFYDLTFQPDSTDSKRILNEEFTVLLGNKVAKSESTNSMLLNQWRKTEDLDAFLNAMAKGNIPKTLFNQQIYINYPEGEITVIDRIALEKYKYLEPIQIIEWTLHDEKRKIFGYDVQKATAYYGGRLWEAWFTTNVPIRGGPYIFHGLPGLIVQIKDSFGHYVFNLKAVSDPKIFEYIKFSHKDYIVKTKADFFSIRDRFNEDPHSFIMQSVEASGGALIFDDQVGAAKNIQEIARRRNNPIELTYE